MLDKIIFWVLLVWMIGMLVMGALAIREVWRDSSRSESEDGEDPAPPPRDTDSTTP